MTARLPVPYSLLLWRTAAGALSDREIVLNDIIIKQSGLAIAPIRSTCLSGPSCRTVATIIGRAGGNGARLLGTRGGSKWDDGHDLPDFT